MSIKLCVFDMAGTTVDEDNLVYKTVQKVIENQGYPLSLEVVLEHGAGKEKYQAIIDILTQATDCQMPEAIAQAAFSEFKPALKQSYSEAQIQPILGVPELFKQLKQQGIFVVLNTGYNRETAKQLLHKLNWQVGRDIDALITADDVLNGRPHADMINQAMRICGISNSQEVLKAGDSAIDIEEGKNAGCGLTIGVLSGAQNRQQLEQASPDYILTSLVGLAEVLAKV